MIASLPMYARPELDGAHDRLWAHLRDRLRASGIAAPDALNKDIGVWDAWTAPDLVFSQTCNLPYRARLHGKVTLIGAGDYRLPGADPGHYYSVFVVRLRDAHKTPQDFATARFAFNEGLSQSGWGAPQDWATAHGFRFSPALQTGAHAASAHAVAAGDADIASLDAVTWRLLQAHDPVAGKLAVIGRTHQTPALTFITRAGVDPAPYRAALSGAIAALDPADQQALGLYGVVSLPPAAYTDLPLPDPPEF